MLQFAIRIGVGLKVGKIFNASIVFLKKINTFCDLITNRQDRLTVSWFKSIVVAKSTSAYSFTTISVGTSKTSVDRYFLHSVTKMIAQIIAIIVVASSMSPGIFVHLKMIDWKLLKKWQIN